MNEARIARNEAGDPVCEPAFERTERSRPRPGFKVYTHMSDRYGPFYSKSIAATASEALHVLDALLHHQSDVAPHRHHTDGGGDSDHVFALCALLGFQFSPRIPDLKHRRLYSIRKPASYSALGPMIAGSINVGLIRAHWSDILRVAASIRTGAVTASMIMRQLAAYPVKTGWPPRYVNLDGSSARSSRWTGSATRICAGEQGRS